MFLGPSFYNEPCGNDPLVPTRQLNCFVVCCHFLKAFFFSTNLPPTGLYWFKDGAVRLNFLYFYLFFFFTWYPCGDETPSPTPYNARVFKKIREGKRNVVAAGYEIKGKKKLNLECFLILFLKEKIKDCGR